MRVSLGPNTLASKGSDHGRLSHLVESRHLLNDWGHCDLYSGGVDLSRASLGQQGTIMLLRDHPLMSYMGLPNWPPTWTWIEGREDKHPKGEIGTLRAVLLSGTRPSRCLLLMSYEDSFYKGCLRFDDEVFFKHIVEVLQGCSNHSIAEIGSVHLMYTF